MSPQPLSIIVVSFNTRDLLRQCLASILKHPSKHVLPDEIVVVDNSSSDGSSEMVAREFPEVRLLPAGGNLGFARACNLGLSACRGDPLLLLNPDTEVAEDAVGKLADFLAGHPRVAAVGPALTYPNGDPQHSAFRFPTLWMSLIDFFPLNHRLVDSRWNGRYRPAPGGAPFPIDHPLGAAMMLTRKALADIGPLDESFFMYCEEVDWCLRARRRGWQIYHLPPATIVHHAGQSSRQVREEMFIELHRSRYLLFRKHYSGGFLRAHRLITRMGLWGAMAEARWLAARGGLTRAELDRRLWAYQTVWSM